MYFTYNEKINRSGSLKPYNFFGDYIRSKYKCRVYKLPIDAGFLCPNRDGSKGTKGCIFCSEQGSAAFTASASENILDQMQFARDHFVRSDSETKYIAYFQAFTNTHSDLKTLERLYSKAISFENVIGLMIATRPDCLSDEILELIAGYKKENFELLLEIGMQTMHQKSLDFLERCHSHEDTISAVFRASQKEIPVSVHIILGIFNETWNDMMQTADEISSLPISAVKIHHLHVLKGTRLEEYYKKNKVELFQFEEYISILCDFLERLRPDIIVHRLAGDSDPEKLVAPRWGMNKGSIMNAVEDEFRKRRTYQGFRFKAT